MASNTNFEASSTGYDVLVLGEHPPQLNCGICTLIIKHAMHGCTNHAFCKGCITKYIECGIRSDGRVKCPGGCNIIINTSKLEPNHFADRMVNTLKTKCSNAICPWQGDLLDLVQVHQTKCEYAMQLCGNNGCSVNYIKKETTQHDEVCLFKTIKCSYCNNDMIRMNKEKHKVGCLNEQINCKYFDIGCMKQLCRKDIYEHEGSRQVQHMTLIYQSLSLQNNEINELKQQNVTSNEEVTFLKQQIITSNKEITILKQHNATSNNEIILLKKKVEELEIESNKEVAHLHKEVPKLKKEHYKLKKKTKSQGMNASNEIVVSKEKLQSEVFDIKCLKDKLSVARGMIDKVSLVSNDQVMIVQCKVKEFNLDLEKLSECFVKIFFDYLFDLFGLNHHKDLMVELIDAIPYHWYEYINTWHRPSFKLVFPLDLQNIKNIDILIPGKYRITIINNEFMLEQLTEQYHRQQSFDHSQEGFLRTGGYNIQLNYGEKYNLQPQQLLTISFGNNSFVAGYACLEVLY